ncbi:MAG TPA: hypothetical protein VGL81_15935 [Polyangiaceae bacterium]|jgi:hypothetical protein
MRLSLLALLAASPTALGCAGAVSGTADGVDAEPTTTTSAVVAVERTADSAEGSRAEASARFIRVVAPSSTDDALRAIGASLDLPPGGTCAALTSLAGAPGTLVPVVELLDVGGVTLEADGVETRLGARQLPDVTDVVSGVVYARATDPSLLPTSTRYVIHVAGGQGLEAFDLTAAAPGDPGEVQVTGEEVPGTLVASGATVDLSWPADVGVADDVVYVDIRPNGVRCVLDGDRAGHGSVSTLFFDDAGTLVVHRLRRQPLSARGIDSGEVRFDFARTIAYVRR